jgi:hypothetical protein
MSEDCPHWRACLEIAVIPFLLVNLAVRDRAFFEKKKPFSL